MTDGESMYYPDAHVETTAEPINLPCKDCGEWWSMRGERWICRRGSTIRECREEAMRALANAPAPAREVGEEPLLALLARRDKAREYFDSHPDSYAAMADWEAADDDLRKRLAALSTAHATAERTREALKEIAQRYNHAGPPDGCSGCIARKALASSLPAPLPAPEAT